MPSPPNVTWVKVDPPTFDLWGVLVGSLSITGLLAGAAFVLGLAFGTWLIRRRGGAAPPTLLRLDTAPRP